MQIITGVNMARTAVPDSPLLCLGEGGTSSPRRFQTAAMTAPQTAAAQKKYTDAVAKAFPKATVISSQSTYVLEKDLFYNSVYHLSSTGSVYRAELLAADILAQFAKEKK